MLTTEARLPAPKAKTKTNGKRRPARDDDLALARDKAGVIVSQRGKDRGPTDRHGEPIAKRHGEFEVEGEREAAHLKRVNPSPLDRYRNRGELSNDEKENNNLWSAGDRLRTDYRIAKLDQRVVANLQAVGGGGIKEMTDRQVAAWERLARALKGVGMILNPILIHVVCQEKSAADWAISRGSAGKRAEVAGMTTLQLALAALARHYGLTTVR